MQGKFEALCKELNIDTKIAPSEAALRTLTHWYKKHVSHDLVEQDVLTAAREYLEVFLPNLPDNKSESVAAFNNMNALQFAATKGYERFFADLAQNERGMCNIAIERNGMTPLHLAACYGNLHTLKALLAIGANPNTKNQAEESPLFSALFTPLFADDTKRKKKVAIFNALKIAAPNSVLQPNNCGETLAHRVAMHGYASILSDLIKNYRTLIFCPDNFLKYPIHYAVINEHPEIVTQLLAEEGVPLLANTDGMVALHYAAHSNDPQVLNACLRVYKDIDLPDCMGKTPLLHAAEAGNFEALQNLVDHKANVLATDMNNTGVLHYAVLSANEEMVSWLLNYLELDINLLTNDGKTALDYACQNKYDSISNLLVKHGGEHAKRATSYK